MAMHRHLGPLTGVTGGWAEEWKGTGVGVGAAGGRVRFAKTSTTGVPGREDGQNA